jgi:hypothetical protein
LCPTGAGTPQNNRAANAQETRTLKEAAVGTLMIKCPNTGRAISTGMAMDGPSFASTPVFFSRTFCPFCRTNHHWFAKDAWVSDRTLETATPTATDSRMRIDAPVLAAWALRAQRRHSR